ncbi:MAG: dihydroorotate dehydrogenase [Ignavibacteria bacterium]|nr:dihydroorotate dehydrogenase [Ignavibacteria bacterium]
MSEQVKTAFELKGVSFKNRVFVASGTFGYGDECLDLIDPSTIGGIVTKSLSRKRREGNPPDRIVETAGGMLNSIGLANIGVEAFVREKLPRVKTLGTGVVANIAASSIDEYCEVLEMLEREEGVDAFEINVSCPNVREGGLSFGMSCPLTEELTRALRPRTRKPLIIKLTPNVSHISEFARAVEGAGADAVSVINTLIGLAIDVETRKPKLSTVTGGLSGPAIKPVALAKVYEVSRAVSIPVFGIGGISDARDAIEFLLAGASAVQIGTANFVDPSTATRVAAGIESYCSRHGIVDVSDLIGAMDASQRVSVVDTWL